MAAHEIDSYDGKDQVVGKLVSLNSSHSRCQSIAHFAWGVSFVVRLVTGYSVPMKKKHFIQTKYGNFQVSIWYDKRDTAYLVETVGFDKTMTFGRSLAEAKRMAKDLLELLVECEHDAGRAVVDSAMRITGKGVKPGSVLELQHA